MRACGLRAWGIAWRRRIGLGRQGRTCQAKQDKGESDGPRHGAHRVLHWESGSAVTVKVQFIPQNSGSFQQQKQQLHALGPRSPQIVRTENTQGNTDGCYPQLTASWRLVGRFGSIVPDRPIFLSAETGGGFLRLASSTNGDRPRGSSKPKKVRKQLAKGIGILKVAKSLGIGTGTVQRISKE